uniref:SRPBCC family protein n=1 Tax=uncultured Altererythrobacter sp. TaxID=500840 RepID=UPI0026225FFE|nr:SRPBCC domain-containing protein [uncultured Altererythrobacter sp.]
MKTNVEWVRIERELSAPIKEVWAMWTVAERFAQWYGPNGMTVSVIEMDLVKGGKRMISMEMQSPERSMKMWFSGEHTDVTEPTRLSYTESMCDEQGKLIPPEQMGMPPGHPDVTEVVVQLEQVGTGTMMKLTHIGVPADSGGAGGWAQAIEKLAKQLR